jgi:hypothetical protein
METCLWTWSQRQHLKGKRAIPILVLRGIWLTQNALLFNQKYIPPFQVSAQVVAIFQVIKKNKLQMIPHQVGSLQIDNSNPWGFFDGACHDEDRRCSLGGLLYLNEKDVCSFYH